jgi:hypothetical protein
MLAMRRVPAALIVLAACSTAPAPDRAPKADELARALARFAEVHYEARLAAERKTEPPPLLVQLDARNRLERALRELGIELAAGDDAAALSASLAAARKALVENGYVFLPMPGDDDDDGIALGKVRRREPARSRELWGRRVEYKLVWYEPVVLDWPSWRAARTATGAAYSPGRFSKDAVYVDVAAVERRLPELPPTYRALGVDGVAAEVELRQAAYLLFRRELGPRPGAQALERWHERVLWTALRYGNVEVARADIQGLARAENAPPDLRAAATRVNEKLPDGATEVALRKIAETTAAMDNGGQELRKE